MSSPARLKELRDEVAGIRRRLEDWVRRLAALRATAGSGDARAAHVDATPPPEVGADAADVPARPGAAPRVPPGPLFHGSGLGGGALDDVELTFEVLDTEDPGREGR
jgi:hypothetical protein